MSDKSGEFEDNDEVPLCPSDNEYDIANIDCDPGFQDIGDPVKVHIHKLDKRCNKLIKRQKRLIKHVVHLHKVHKKELKVRCKAVGRKVVKKCVGLITAKLDHVLPCLYWNVCRSGCVYTAFHRALNFVGERRKFGIKYTSFKGFKLDRETCTPHVLQLRLCIAEGVGSLWGIKQADWNKSKDQKEGEIAEIVAGIAKLCLDNTLVEPSNYGLYFHNHYRQDRGNRVRQSLFYIPWEN
mmetsp:Transcript_39593/g.66488  ORF Transcript_39593/g.66488 Transcript_39593/m.66488 type:complete len:238 (-) Transcript_39593:384-1097(-)